MNLNPLSAAQTANLPANTDATQRSTAPRQQGLLAKSMAMLDKLGDLAEKRVEQLNQSMTSMAQSLIQSFAGSFLGDAAKGAKIEFDSFSLASQSSFSALSLEQRDENGRISASAFRLEEASQFIGRGTITTADGRSFEFEMDIRYSLELEAASISQQSNKRGGQAPAALPATEPAAATPAPAATAPSTASAPATAPSLPFQQAQFAGTAAELFERLRNEPVRVPFNLQLPEQGATPQTLFGDLAMRLLNLPGGERYLDLLPQTAQGEPRKTDGVDLLA